MDPYRADRHPDGRLRQRAPAKPAERTWPSGRPSPVPESGRRRVGEASPRNWKDALGEVRREVGSDRLSMVAAGVAFYAFLALFPALTAVISVWGLLSDPAQAKEQILALQGTLPPSASELIGRAAERIAGSSPTRLGWGVALSLLLTIWSSNKGMKGLVQGVQIAYDEDNERGFVKENLVTIELTLGALVMTIVALGAVVGIPAVLGSLGLGATGELVVSLVRWPLLALAVVAALSVVYRKGRQHKPRGERMWRWGVPGAATATLLWLLGSIAFSLYVENFGSYDKMYASVAAVAILLMWFFVSAYVALLGAEVNAAFEPGARGARRAARGRG